MSDNIQELKNKLSRLAILDKNFEVFGSESHQYKLNPCLSEIEIQELEAKYKIRLPFEFREFLLKVGNGGVGPGYGLIGIDRVELSKIELTGLDFLSLPFPLHQEWNDLDLLQNSNGNSPDAYYDANLVQGSLLVAEYGCGIEARLVITGEQSGKIWIDDRVGEGGIYPLTNHCAAFFHDDPDIEDNLYESVEEVKEALTFYEWYDNWLNRSISQVVQLG
ncbi:MAG: SMI1/KNR4 family protein [Calothrix sp. C42_A2020_038]|nr:SMI1/KNR4 family protein [Calothrix sp. C42_A2020_038]